MAIFHLSETLEDIRKSVRGERSLSIRPSNHVQGEIGDRILLSCLEDTGDCARGALFRVTLTTIIRLHDIDDTLTALAHRDVSYEKLLGCSREEFIAHWNEVRKPEDAWEENPQVIILQMAQIALPKGAFSWVVDPLLDVLPTLKDSDG